MTKGLFVLNSILIVFVLTILCACEGDNVDKTVVTPVFDCPDINANIGDDCVYTIEENGQTISITSTINETCECEEIDNPTFDCPNLQANIGDACDLPDVPNGIGVLNENCECVEEELEYDCPELNLNIGDVCTYYHDTGNGSVLVTSTVNDSCECQEIEFDCPNLGLNIGDDCSLINEFGVVDENCECVEGVVYDCPEEQANIGDECYYTVQTETTVLTFISTINANCECEELTFDCPDLYANIGSDCVLPDGNVGVVTAGCECQ